MAEAMTALTPIKKLCMEKPLERCSSGSISPTRATEGPSITFSEASRIHSMAAAIHSSVELGMTSSAVAAAKAPAIRNGRRRPKRFQVLSLR